MGFIRRGQFHLLFSAACPLGERELGHDVPDTFKQLIIGTPVFGQPRLPGCLRTDTVREFGASVDATVSPTVYVPSRVQTSTCFEDTPSRPLELGASFSFELTGNRGAALVTKYPTYREDTLLESALARYTKRHYKSWVKFARDKQYGDDIQPVLVSGFDMTGDFAMVAYSHGGTSLEADLTIAVPALGSASASLWGTWRTRCTPHTNCGPQVCNPPPHVGAIEFPSAAATAGEIPGEFNQCVFIRYYTMRSRKRMPMFPEVIRAGAGPHDLGSGENEGSTFPALVVQSDDDFPMSDEEDLDVQWTPTADGDGSEADVVVRNMPSVRHFQWLAIYALNFARQDVEDNNWDAIAEYMFQVIRFSVTVYYQDDQFLNGRSPTPTLC